MSTEVVGLLKKDINVYDIFKYIQENVDIEATIDKQSDRTGRSNYISFKYKDERRNMHIFSNCIDYQESTHYKEKTTCISLGLSGLAPEAVLKPIVQYFGGFYIPNDCGNDCFFFPFKEELLKKYPLEKAIFDRLTDEKNWETKIKIMEFIKNNLDFLTSLKSR